MVQRDGGMFLQYTEGEVLDFGLVCYCTESLLDSIVVFCILCICLSAGVQQIVQCDGGMVLQCTEGEVLDYRLVCYCSESHLDTFVVCCILCI